MEDNEHPNIIKCWKHFSQVINNSHYYCIVTEYCPVHFKFYLSVTGNSKTRRFTNLLTYNEN